MSKKVRNTLVILLLTAVFLIVTALTSADRGGNYPDYTIFSTGEQGVSLLYDTLDKLGVPVSPGGLNINESLTIDNVQIIIAPSFFDQEEEMAIADWVFRGGRIVFLQEDYYPAHLLRLLGQNGSSRLGDLTLYTYGMGKACFGRAQTVTNAALMENPAPGSQILAVIESMTYDAVIFNESYHGYAVSNRIWDGLPFSIKLIFVQAVVIAAAWVLHRGRRFGKPLTYYEEEERKENEYVYTLSNLYQSAGMGGAAIEVYREKLFDAARKYFNLTGEPSLEELARLWEENRLPANDKMKYLSANLKDEYNTKKAADRQEFIKAVTYLRELSKVL